MPTRSGSAPGSRAGHFETPHPTAPVTYRRQRPEATRPRYSMVPLVAGPAWDVHSAPTIPTRSRRDVISETPLPLLLYTSRA
jgi:hypothetical protein